MLALFVVEVLSGMHLFRVIYPENTVEIGIVYKTLFVILMCCYYDTTLSF